MNDSRQIIETGEVIGPLTYVHECPGDVDSWMAVGDEPCVVHVEVNGTVDYLADDGAVAVRVDAEMQRALYVTACAERGHSPLPRWRSSLV